MLHNNLLRPALTTWKNSLVLTWNKSFRCPSSFVCRSGFSTFCTCPTPTIHQIYHFAIPHLCWCNNTIVQIRTWFSVFNGPNHLSRSSSEKL